MSSKVETIEGERGLVISCDAANCETLVSSVEIAEQKGLLQMGWTTKFNDLKRVLEHFCPAHADQGAKNGY